MGKSKLSNVYLMLLLPVFAVAIIPWLKYRIPFRIVLPIVFLWGVVALVDDRKQVKSTLTASFWGLLIAFTIYACLDVINGVIGLGDGMTYPRFVDFFFSVFFLCVLHISVVTRRYEEIKILAICCLVFLLISAVMSFIGYGEEEGASRYLTGGLNAADRDMALDRELREMGVGGYGSAYYTGILITPVLFCIRKVNGSLKVLLSFFVVLCSIFVYKASFTILTISSVFVFLTFLFWSFVLRSKRLLKPLVWFGAIFFCILIIYPTLLSFLSGLFYGLEHIIANEEYQFRLKSIGDALSGVGETYVVNRSELYWKSWNTFLQNPIFGMGRYDLEVSQVMIDKVGGHSMIFDLLAVNGLFGVVSLISLVVMYVKYFSKLSQQVIGSKSFPAISFFLMQLAIIAFINPVGGYFLFLDLFFIMPALLFILKRSRVIRIPTRFQNG